MGKIRLSTIDSLDDIIGQGNMASVKWMAGPEDTEITSVAIGDGIT